MKKLATLLLFSTFVIALMPLSASAVEYGGVGGQPANPRADNPRTQSIFIYELETGQTTTDAVRVFNNTSSERTIQIGAVDSALASDGAFSCAQEVESKKDVGGWIKLATTSVTIPAGGSKDVSFTVTVPKSASVGEHGGCITMQDSQTQTDSQQNGVVLNFRSAIRVAITVPGNIVKSLEFTAISLTKSNDNTYTANPTISNTGNVSIDTNITVKLISILGVVTDSKTGTYPVLPSSNASWGFQLNSPFWGGFYRTEATATYNNDTSVRLGETSSGSLTTKTIHSNYTFVAPSPLAGLIEAVIFLALVAATTLFIKKRTHKRQVKHKWSVYSTKQGDTVQRIARDHDVSWKKLATANKLRPPYDIEPGTRLKVPPKTSR